ncbi:MAG: cadherin-like domain-containing protein, partial [Nanoarchaeota archaeon]|nr:cadherin-like domain-containing protein [Nanoarchaeota archaeon]
MALNPLALDCVERYSRTFEFAGHTWGVKEAPLRVGPGPQLLGGNYFSNDANDVFVDDDGLHLTIHERGGKWWSTEVILVDDLGYGTYGFQTDSRTDTLPANVTFGAFTWDSYGDESTGGSFREIDFEDSRWGNATDPTNAQIVVQPYQTSGNLLRYTIPDLTDDAALTRFFSWSADSIEFVALQGHHDPFDYPAEKVIFANTFHHDPTENHFVPTAGRANYRFNLWLNSGTAPADGQPIEVVISDFRFAASAPPVANDDLAAITEGVAVVVDVLTNDVDPEGHLDPASVAVTSAPAAGSVIVQANGEITYTPAQDFSGIDSFRYTVADTDGGVSNEATVTVRVAADDFMEFSVAFRSPAGAALDQAVIGESFVVDVDRQGF